MSENKEMKGTAEYVPGSDAKAGNADEITRAYLDSLLLILRHMGNNLPETNAVILGHPLNTPVLAGALALLGRVRPEGAAGFARGVKAAGTILWTGWLEDEEFKSVAETGVRCIRGIKPFADEDKIFRAMETAAESGASGVFMDIDHCMNDSGKDCEFPFGKLSHKSITQLKSYVKAAEIPFIFKGILSVEDAMICNEIGASAIVVSHHKGIWSYAVPPLHVLPEIREAVGRRAAAGKDGRKRMEIYTDCGLKNGVDVFKALACGADGVCVARPLMAAYAKGGHEAVTEILVSYTEELAGTMGKTGAAKLTDISSKMLVKRDF